ncbi:MAG: glycosyltransferase family 9 protein, partial [Sphaerochaetaceae bacterium]
MKDYRGYFLRLLATLIDVLGWLVFFWLPRSAVKPEIIKKILILKFDRIGDAFLALPTIEALRQIFPAAQLTVACSPWNKSVLANNPAIDQLLFLESLPDVHHSRLTDFLCLTKIKQIANFIKEQQTEVVVDLQGSPMNVLAMFWSGSKYRLGYRKKVFSFLLTQGASYQSNQPQAEIYFSLARLLGYTKALPPALINVAISDLATTDHFINHHQLANFIIIHLGAGRSYRQWPVANFAALAQRIIDNYSDYKLVVIGGSEDQSLFDKLAAGLSATDRLINAIGQLNIPASYQLIGQAKLFIGNESGPGHLAAAQGVPTISFMNPWSGINRWQARGPQVSLFYKSAHHCQGIRCRINPCPNMVAITVDEAWSQVQDWLIS